jgi:hypothetical protein
MPVVTVLSKRSESLPEVPWVMGDPTSSYKWQVSVADGKKKKRGKRIKPEKFEKVMMRISLKGKKTTVKLNMLKKGVREDFNPMTVTSDIIRGLHLIKLREIKVIKMRPKAQFEWKPYAELIKLLDELKFEGAEYNDVRVDAVLKPSIEASVRIRKIHKKGRPSITIGIFGRIRKDRVSKLAGYLKKHLPIERMEY